MSNTSWTATKDDAADWLTLTASVSLGNGMIDVVITITYGTSSTEEMVSVSQAAGDATLTASPNPLTFAPGGESCLCPLQEPDSA